MNYHNLRAIIRQIKKLITCPDCESNFTNKDINIKKSEDNDMELHIKCSKCGKKINANMSISVETVKLNSTREHRSIKSFNKNKISKDEYLDFQNFINNFEGNFKEHLEDQ